MYENETFENLARKKIEFIQDLARKQGIVLDTRTASMIYFAVAANSFETGQAYIELDQVLNESFADTASRSFLIRRAAERGLSPNEAAFAIRRGEFNIDIPIGSRFSLNKLDYIVTEKISDGIFRLQCETAGNIGNLESGTLIPIDYLDGLTFARLTDVLIPGEDEESTEAFRQRYYDNLNAQAFGGNIRDYVEKTLAIPGVGGVKVYRAWNGGGTVKLVILDSQYHKPSDYLIDAVQTIIDPEQNQGEGMPPPFRGIIPNNILIVNLKQSARFKT